MQSKSLPVIWNLWRHKDWTQSVESLTRFFILCSYLLLRMFKLGWVPAYYYAHCEQRRGKALQVLNLPLASTFTRLITWWWHVWHRADADFAWFAVLRNSISAPLMEENCACCTKWYQLPEGWRIFTPAVNSTFLPPGGGSCNLWPLVSTRHVMYGMIATATAVRRLHTTGFQLLALHSPMQACRVRFALRLRSKSSAPIV